MWFGKYLIQCGDISEHQLVESIATNCEARISIGNLAINSDTLTMKQVFEILELQVTTDRPFGQIGIELGYMTQRDLFYLLGRQRTQGSWQRVLLRKKEITPERLEQRLHEWHATSRKQIASESDFLGP